MSDSVRPHRQQPTRLPRPWDSPGKNTGVGYHFLLQCMKVKSESEVAHSCPTLSDPMDCSLPGPSVHGIFQARVLEWGAIAFCTCAYDPHKKEDWIWFTFSPLILFLLSALLPFLLHFSPTKGRIVFRAVKKLPQMKRLVRGPASPTQTERQTHTHQGRGS